MIHQIDSIKLKDDPPEFDKLMHMNQVELDRKNRKLSKLKNNY